MGYFVDILKKGAKKLVGYAAGGGLGLDLIQQGGNYLNGLINQHFAEQERAKNFEWNEKAAQAADRRQRAQYWDLYSPEAMIQQYRAAGLSPSLMMNAGAPVVGGTPTSNMGAGTSGAYPAPGNNPLMGAQIANILADTEGKETDNALKEIQKNMQEIYATKAKYEWHILNGFLYEGNKKTSFGDFARKFKSFEDFKENVMKQNLDEYTKEILTSENGERILRGIFQSVHSLENDIAVLSSSKMNAQVMEKVSRLLYNSDYANASTDATIKQLKQISESAELTTTQKEAFNNLIEKLGGGTFQDIVIVLLMVLAQFQQSSFNLDFGSKTTYTGSNNQVINQQYHQKPL